MPWYESFYRKQGKKWLLVFIIAFISLFIFEMILIAIEPLWAEFNEYLGDSIGSKLNYVLIFLIIIGIPLTYSAVLLIINLKKIFTINGIDPHTVHKILAVILIIVINTLLFIMLDLFGEGAAIISHLFENINILIFIGVAIGIIIILGPIITIIKKSLKRPKSILILICFITAYGFIFSLPFLYVPANVIEGPLPPKPGIVAHRGASHLAPENTIEAAEVAVDYGCVGWESDVMISYDGVPFLMHDSTLKRTTNVEAIFPDRSDLRASNFTLSELKQLDAGSWFVDKDPYYAITKGLITPTQAEEYRGIKIPTFEEALNFTRDNNLLFDFDLRRPPEGHPYRSQFYNICIDLIIAAGIEDKIWIPTGDELFDVIEDRAPNITKMRSACSVDEFLTSDYDQINTHYSLSNTQFKEYSEVNISVVAYTVDFIERYSQLWCLGVNYVKTNEPHKFAELTQPLWYLPVDLYYSLWIAINTLCLVSVIILNYLIRKDNRQ
ncbi:hypothetical protein ES706_04468 [subsurface metagenome]